MHWLVMRSPGWTGCKQELSPVISSDPTGQKWSSSELLKHKAEWFIISRYLFTSYHLFVTFISSLFSSVCEKNLPSTKFIFPVPNMTNMLHKTTNRCQCWGVTPPPALWFPPSWKKNTWQRWKECLLSCAGKKKTCVQDYLCVCVVNHQQYNGTECQMCPCYIIDDSDKHKVCMGFPHQCPFFVRL